jgi:biopolymer transport protein ExbB
MTIAGQITIDKISGPVGEALLMTAAGLVVAIPAVLAYNVLGRLVGQIEADLEGFAFDLRELLLTFATETSVGAKFSHEPPLGELVPLGGSAVRAATSVGA